MSTTEAILEKLSALAPEQQEQVLQLVETLSRRAAPHAGDTDPHAWLKEAMSLDLQVPPDWSERFHEYLYGDNARDSK